MDDNEEGTISVVEVYELAADIGMLNLLLFYYKKYYIINTIK